MLREQEQQQVDGGEAQDSSLDRRRFLGKVGAAGLGAGALAVGARIASAADATGPVAPPSTVTSPPRDFGPKARRTSISGIRTSSRSIRPSMASRSRTRPFSACGPERCGPRARRGTPRAATSVWSDIPNNRQMRWIEDDGRGHRVPRAVQQQQRQHLRLPGPADLLRASDPARRPLRARRLGHRARRLLQGQAAELAQRRRAASGRQRLVHRSAVRRAALRRHPRCAGRARATRRQDQQPSSASQSASATAKRELPTQVYRWDPSGTLDNGGHRRQGARTPTASASRPITRSST